MATSIETKLRTAALGFSGLTSLLGGATQNSFRWYDTQLRPGQVFPSIVVTLVSDPADYTFAGELATSFARVQFDIWDTDPERAFTVQEQLQAFLRQFNGYGLNVPANANYVLNRAKTNYPDLQPPLFRRMLDVRVFNNSTI